MPNGIKYFQILLVLAICSIFAFLYTTSFEFRHLRRQSFERRIRIDRRQAPSEKYFVESIKRQIPYLPIEDLVNPDYKSRNFNRTCARYPTLTDVKIHNEYWQEFHNLNYSYLIFGAYLDKRPSVVHLEPVVRVMFMMNFIGKNYNEYPLTYCQLWYKEQHQPIITVMKGMHKLWYYEWQYKDIDRFGHFIDCPLPKEHLDWIPKSVSLVVRPCENATNNLRIIYQPLLQNETKKEFAVCHKTLDYPGLDNSYRFVEYFETLKILGAQKITMYHYVVHPNTTKVLEYYQKIGFLEYRAMTLSTAVSNFENYRHLEMTKNEYSAMSHEVIHYNDCFYRNMYRFKYIAVIDNDELIMPLGNLSSWHDLTSLGETQKHKNCKKFSSFCFRCIYFPKYPAIARFTTDIPEYFYMLQHVSRVRKHLQFNQATKCLHSTDFVLAVHNHFPFDRVPNVCWFHTFDKTVAQLNHYREPPEKETLNDPVLDFSLWRFKDAIVNSSMKIFEKLEFLRSD